MLVLCVLLFTLMSPSLIQAASLTTDFFPYGSFEGDSTLQRSNEAGSSSQIIELEEGARFYGNTYSRITVNSNGVMIFGNQPLIQDVLEPFPRANNVIVAPFWATANYSVHNTAGKVYYRISDSSVLLQKAGNAIDQAYVRVGLVQEPVNPSKLVILTWEDLRSTSDQTEANTFQCTLAISSASTYVFFHYADGLMEWGGNTTPVLIGFNAGDGVASFTLPTSLTPAVLQATRTGNTGVNGQWLFRVDGGEVTLPGAIIGLSQVYYTVDEGEGGEVEICSSPLVGTLAREERISHIVRDITANDESDYISRGLRTLTFRPNDNTTQCSSVFIASDSIYEYDETFEVHLSRSAHSLITLLPLTATITIRDDDSVFVNYNSISTVEELGEAQICVDLSHPVSKRSLCSSSNLRTQRPVEVTYRTSSGDAEDGVDYISRNGTITIRKGLCVGCSIIQIIDDQIYEEREKFSYTVTAESVRTLVNTSVSSADINITDNDGPLVTIGMTQEIFSVLEGEQVTVCAAMTTGSISQPLVVRILTGHVDQLVGESILLASDNQDFLVLREEITFIPSRPREIKCVNITTYRDNRYEGTECRGIILETDTTVSLSPKEAVLHILDKNEVGVAIEKTHYDYLEGATNRRLNVCANLTGEIERELRVHVQAHEGTAKFFDINTARTGDVHRNIDDIIFRVDANTNLPSGAPRAPRVCNASCITCTQVTIQNDFILEDLYETFSLSLSHADSSVHVTSSEASVSIQDNDKIQIILLHSDQIDSILLENATSVPRVCAQRDGLTDVDFTVGLIPHGITAADDVDFTISSDIITFTASNGERETRCSSVSITLLDDEVVEEDETLELVLESSDPERILVTRFGNPQARILTIADNDNVSVNFKNRMYEVSEGEGGIEVCLEMVGLSAIPQTVVVTTWPGSAEVGVDYLPQSLSFQFPPTDVTILNNSFSLSVSERLRQPLPLSPPVCANVSIINDDILEANKFKSFFLNLSHPGPVVQLRTPHVATVIIADDDDVTIIIDEASQGVTVTEGEEVQICARMLNRANFPVTASFQTLVTESARDIFDFVSVEQEIEFPPKTIGPQCVTIQTVEDSTVERAEIFEVRLSVPEEMSVTPGENMTTATVTIMDNDFVEVGFESSEYSVVEGEGIVEVCATLTGLLDLVPVSVLLSVSSQEQDLPDYIPPPDTLLFQNQTNQSSQRECVSISISNDTTLEDTESFEVSLSSPPLGVVHITRGDTTVYIIDDDGVRIGLRERELSVVEREGNSIPTCIELVGEIQRNIEVMVETQSLTANADSDYQSISTTLTFSPELAIEQEICFNVTVMDDSIFEDDESFLLLLRVEHAAVSIHIHRTNISILDDDYVTLTMATNETVQVESAGGYDVCLELSGPIEKTVSYQLDIRSLEAVLGIDFLFTPETDYIFPSFIGTRLTKCHHVTIVDDTALEDTERFEAELSTVSDVPRLLLDISRTEVTIVDNDMVTVGFSQTVYVIDEDGGDEERMTSVCIELIGEIERSVSVLVTSQSESADADDFDAVDREVVFSPSDNVQTHCFTVSVRHDRTVEQDETFFLASSSNDPQVILDPQYAHFTITDRDVICLESSLDTSRGYFTWPQTYPGEVSEIVCERGETRRACSVSGFWQTPFITNCYVSTEELFRYIEKHGFSEHNLEETLFAINQLHREKDMPKPKYAEIINMILAEFAELTERNQVPVDEQIFEVLVKIINGIQTWPKDVLEDYSSSIINSYERTTISIFKPRDFASFKLALQSTSFLSNKATPSELFPQDKLSLRFTFHKDQDGNIVVLNEERSSDYEASITLPKSMAEVLTGPAKVGLFLAYYDSGVMFPLDYNETEHTNTTSVVAASFAGLDLSNLRDDVIITFKLNDVDSSNVTCVSWDFEENEGLGKWVEDGCSLVSVEGNEATCSCNHLTNFACLVDNFDMGPSTDGLIQTQNSYVTSLLSIIGSCVSILGLLLTIITLLGFSPLRRRDNTKYRIQLCTSIILMLVVFTTGIDQVDSFIFCVAASSLLHYFTLVNSMWLVAELVLTFQKLTGLFSHPSTCYLVVTSLLCWSLPIIPVIVPVGIDRELVINQKYCFSDHSITLFGGFLGPLAVLVLIILILVALVLCAIARYSSKSHKGTKNACKRRGASRSIFVIIAVTILLGVTWTFGAFTTRGASEYFQYIFVALNSLLGFFIFLLFVVFTKETQDLLLQTCGCKKKRQRENIVSAIIDTSIGNPHLQRVALDENADRLRELEEVDHEKRLGMTSWDITFVPPTQQSTRLQPSYKLEEEEDIIKEPDFPSATDIRPGHSPQEETPSKDHTLPDQENSVGLTRSMGSIQNADTTSIADSGIADSLVMTDRTPKHTPSSGDLQHPQSGSTPKHIHSVSGIGYISDDSSMENIPTRVEDCYNIGKKPISITPSLRPRAIPNEYTRVHVDSPGV